MVAKTMSITVLGQVRITPSGLFWFAICLHNFHHFLHHFHILLKGLHHKVRCHWVCWGSAWWLGHIKCRQACSWWWRHQTLGHWYLLLIQGLLYTFLDKIDNLSMIQSIPNCQSTSAMKCFLCVLEVGLKSLPCMLFEISLIPLIECRWIDLCLLYQKITQINLLLFHHRSSR